MRYLLIIAVIAISLVGSIAPPATAAAPLQNIPIAGDSVPTCPDLMLIPIPSGETMTLTYVDYYVYSVIADNFGISYGGKLPPFGFGGGISTTAYTDLSGTTGQSEDFYNNNMTGTTITLSICRNYAPPPTATATPQPLMDIFVSYSCPASASILVGRGSTLGTTLNPARDYRVWAENPGAVAWIHDGGQQDTLGTSYATAQHITGYSFGAFMAYGETSPYPSTIVHGCAMPTMPTPTPTPSSDVCDTQVGLRPDGIWHWVIREDFYSQKIDNVMIDWKRTVNVTETLGIYYDAVASDIINYEYSGAGISTGTRAAGSSFLNTSIGVGGNLPLQYLRDQRGKSGYIVPGTWTDDPVVINFNFQVYAAPPAWSRGRLCLQIHELAPYAPPTPTSTRTPTSTSGPTNTAIIPQTRTRTPTRTSGPTSYPTAVATCVHFNLAIGISIDTVLADNALVRVLNGTAYVVNDYGVRYLVGTGGMNWDAPGSNELVTLEGISISDGGSTLVVEICQNGSNATPTQTTTPTAPALPCPVADSIGVPVAPGTADLDLAPGTRFVVAGAVIWVNVGSQAREIQPGNYTWNMGSGTFTAYSLTLPATVWICAGSGGTATATGMATFTPGPVDIGGTPVCVVLASMTPTIAFSMPDLGIVIPTLRPIMTPTGTITVSIVISTTAIAAFVGTVQAGINTPAAAAATAAGGFSWDKGVSLSATAQAVAAPALSWMAVLNGANPAWQVEGGPLWALAPALLPISPILAAFSLVALVRFLIFLWGVFLKAVDIVFKLIELIPGE